MYEVVVESSRPMIEVLSPLDGAVVGSVPDASKDGLWAYSSDWTSCSYRHHAQHKSSIGD
jgi:hypothetical protein